MVPLMSHVLDSVTSTLTTVEGIPMVGLSAPVLLGLVVIFIMTGKIVPRRNMEDVIRDRDQWREAHKTSEAAREESMRQVGELLSSVQRSEAVLQKLADLILIEKGAKKPGGGNQGEDP